MALTREDTEAISQMLALSMQGVGVEIGRAVGEAIAPVMREVSESQARRTDDLRRDVFDAVGKRVSRDECTRTHAALPPVAILGAVGALGVIQVVAMWLLSKG